MEIKDLRYFLKDELRDECDPAQSPEKTGKQPLPEVKPIRPDQELIPLPAPGPSILQVNDLFELIRTRRSRRRFQDSSISLAELGWLCFAVQGMPPSLLQKNRRRTVPLAGNRHSFETYLAVMNVDGLTPGIYRYLPPEHALVFEHEAENISERLGQICRGQTFVGTGAVTFLFTTLPYRTEWRYQKAAAKTIALDAGHVMQNLYLAADSIGCGTCAIASYISKLADELLGVDGEDEFTIYIAPVGRVPD